MCRGWQELRLFVLVEAFSDDGGVYRLALMEAVPTGLQQFVVDSGLTEIR